MKEKSNQECFTENTSLTEEEASDLAAALKSKLLQGERPYANKDLIKKIVAGLGDNRGLLRRTFSESLGLIGEEVLPEVRKVLLKSENVIARRAAAKTLRLIGDPSALPDLLEALLTDKDPVVQGSSVGAMAVFGEEAIKHFIKVLERPDSSEMQCGLASWGLSYIGGNGARELKKATKSTIDKVRASSIAALGEQIQSLCDKEAKNIVHQALNDKSIEVQIEAIKLIGLLDDQEWDGLILVDKLTHQNPEIRKQSALSLMKLNSIDQIESLKSAFFKEKNIQVRDVLSLSIKKLKNIEIKN